MIPLPCITQNTPPKTKQQTKQKNCNRMAVEKYLLFSNCLIQQRMEGEEVAAPGWKYTDVPLSQHKLYKWNHGLCVTHSGKGSPSCHLK